ncbi:CPBP family intramembrane glutamic endopeptidase [Tistrella bauzanensis]
MAGRGTLANEAMMREADGRAQGHENAYLAQGLIGRSGTLVYIVGILTILLVVPLLAAQVIGPIQMKLISTFGPPDATVNLFATKANIAGFLIWMAMFPIWILGVFLVVRLLNARPFLTLISPERQYNLRLIAKAFIIYLPIVQASSLAGMWLQGSPIDLELAFEPAGWVAGLVLGGFLYLIQATSDELVFRAYPLQGLYAGIGRPVVAAVGASVIFAAYHYSPNNTPMVYVSLFVAGLFAAALTVKAQRLEPAIGVHLANNMALFSIIQNPEVTPAEPIWRLMTPAGMSWWMVATAIAAALIFWWCFSGWPAV